MSRFLLPLAGAVALAACSGDDAALVELEATLAATEAQLAEAEAAAQSASEQLTGQLAALDQAAQQAMANVADRADLRGDLIGRDGETIGEVFVLGGPHGMILRISGSGLPIGLHGSHLHVGGNCSDAADGFKAAGGHINLTQDEHGLLNPAGYHVGSNFPNFWIGGEVFVIEAFANDLTLDQAMDEDGFSLIIHESEDDHVSQPIGGAGGRVACAAFN